jgi:D-alanyl-D-alanine carboxypeptidase/D-alanyl-D-alanine-endopeptidase (penicillin-binding protein 4)
LNSADFGMLGKTHKITCRLLAASFILWVHPAAAQVPLRQAIDDLIRQSPASEATLAVRVICLPAGQVIYSVNADEPMIPASNMKLLTTAAAAALLGEDFQFRTLLARRGEDLVIIGGGDPATGDPRLALEEGVPITAMFHRWADRLAEAGWTDIAGDLVFDDSIFDGQWRHESWPPDEADRWYAAPVGGLNFNDSCLTIAMQPSRPGEPIEFECSPRQTTVQVSNRCTTGGKGSAVVRRAPDSDEIVLNGRLRKPLTVDVAIRDPGLFFAGACRTAMAARGVRIRGDTRRDQVRQTDGSLPPDLQVVAEHATPMSAILERCNKDSQNLFAECLLKTLGCVHARRTGSADAIGSWPAGQQAVLKFLQDAGLPTEGVVIDDGCGLSRQNRVPARLMTELLRYVHAQPFGELFVQSLSVSGRDGTLAKRLDGSYEGQLLGKSGYVRGVRTLSGYVVTRQGHWLAVSILVNEFTGSSTPFTRLQDDICKLLVHADLSLPAEGGQ